MSQSQIASTRSATAAESRMLLEKPSGTMCSPPQMGGCGSSCESPIGCPDTTRKAACCSKPERTREAKRDASSARHATGWQRTTSREGHGAGSTCYKYPHNELLGCSPFNASTRLLLLECCLWRVPEADRHSVGGLHQADRDREISQLLLGKHSRRGVKLAVRHCGVGDAGDCLGPGQCSAFAGVEPAAGLTPNRDGAQ